MSRMLDERISSVLKIVFGEPVLVLIGLCATPLYLAVWLWCWLRELGRGVLR